MSDPVLYALSALLACHPPEPEPSVPDTCNGHRALCDRTFDTVALPAAHNAMSNEDDGWTVSNQPHGLARQLEDGIRGMLLDTYPWNGDLYLCHGYCELGATPLADALAVLRDFLDAHRGEVMVIIFEDGITAEQTAGAFAAADLDRLTYTWDGGAWPTLGEMVAADTRLLVTAEQGGPPPDWYQHAWDLYVDTPYDFATVDDFTCDVNRGAPTNPLFLLNHWVEDPFPSAEQAAEANAYAVLHDRAVACAEAFGRNPNLVAVDWYTEGDLFLVVDGLNGM